MTLEFDKFKKKLEEERAHLESELSGVSVHADPKHPNDWEATYDAPADLGQYTQEADPMDVAEVIGNYEKGFALNKTLEGQLNQVKHALAKITDGSYGNCDVCRALIPLARLEANPAASTCMAHSK